MQRNRDGHAAFPHIFLAHRAIIRSRPLVFSYSNQQVVGSLMFFININKKNQNVLSGILINAWLVFELLLINYEVLF